ncbi:substrate-binding domain-containing protein [Sulfitobacter aestuarii]|uniref:Substrate-binding domain-containing protein n=1 Tax=Sulfitobacter aestuarii TaxID=2161676 RepID=A0ABW5U8E8_9RHOB
MLQTMQETPPIYLTTREVAELLRVKERKVYDMAAAGEIPHRRITGKLLFPRAEVFAWIEGDGALRPPRRPALLTGSHDPLLDWALRESGCGLASLLQGSAQGLESFAAGEAALAGLHIPSSGEGWNIESVAARELGHAVLISWARRRRGLVLAPGMDARIKSFADLKGHRVARRQEGAGSAVLFAHLLGEHGLSEGDLSLSGATAHTEHDAAAAVAAGEADAAIGLETLARQFHLPFLPLVDEHFDLLIDRRSYFTEPLQLLLAFARGAQVARKAQAMGGYDIGGLGEVRWLSP